MAVRNIFLFTKIFTLPDQNNRINPKFYSAYVKGYVVIKSGMKAAPQIAAFCVGVTCAGIWVVDTLAEMAGYKKPFESVIITLAPYLHKVTT